MDINRRDVLAATGSALLTAGALGAAPEAEAAQQGDDILYGHGMVWNRQLEGEAGELNLSFDLRVNLATGRGLGSAHDPVYPDWNLHFEVNSVQRQRRPRRESRFLMNGTVTRAATEAAVGQQVRIVAETRGDATAIAIRVGEYAFGGAGLIVIDATDTLVTLLIRIIRGR